MTLGDFFNVLSKDPSIIIFYNVAVPTTALLSLYFGKGYGHVSPWKYLYTTLIYLACIPGIFAISLSLYVFLFERRSILDANIYVHILPVLSMIFTLWLIRQNVRLRDIQGFK